MSQKQDNVPKKPRKKAPVLDRTTKEGKQRDAELKRQAREGMAGWLSQGKEKKQENKRLI